MHITKDKNPVRGADKIEMSGAMQYRLRTNQSVPRVMSRLGFFRGAHCALLLDPSCICKTPYYTLNNS
jgi:hypothetical protein